jgi:rhodanese-related sulfurtransferase
MDLARYEDTVFNYLNTEQSALIILYVCFDINIDKPMKKNRLFLIITIATITGLEIMTGCSHNQETLTWVEVISDIRNRYPDVKQLQTAELQSRLTNTDSEPVILIDARAKEEFHVSHISGAKNIPYNSKDPLKHLINIKPENPIVVYCSVGYRSSILASKLQTLGFIEIYNLEGSIFKWANEGRSLVQGQTTVHKVHPYNTQWGNLLEKKYH